MFQIFKLFDPDTWHLFHEAKYAAGAHKFSYWQQSVTPYSLDLMRGRGFALLHQTMGSYREL